MTRLADSKDNGVKTLSRDRERLFNILREQQASKTTKIRSYRRGTETRLLHIPTSSAQQRLWFLDHLLGESAAYHIKLAVRMKGTLDLASLQTALDTVVQRHEVLRTVFVNLEGEPTQEISAEGCFPLKVIDLSGHPQAEQGAHVQSQKAEEARGRFDLRLGPLIRGRLLRIAPEEHILLITMHHIVSDGWSMSIFTRELAEGYAAYREGRDNPFDALPNQYGDYVQWQREWLQGGALDKQLGYWRAHLEGAAPQLELPTDRPRPAVQSYRGDTVGFVLDGHLTSRLRTLAQHHEMTSSMVLGAAWAILLSRLSGQEDVLIGAPVANRQSPELEGLIGFFVNTLVLRLRVRGDLRIEELLEHAKEVSLGAYDHQDVPFEKVVEALQPQRTLTRNPLFQVMLALQNTPKNGLFLPGLTVTLEDVVEETAQFDLLLSLEDRGNDIAGLLNYATDLFNRETIERWISCFTVLLEGMTDHVQGRRVDELPILPEVQRHEVIQLFNATQAVYPQEKLIHELFEEQVERTPDAVALVYEGQSLTYAELNGRANQLAQYLIQKGVGPDQVVGICMERSLEMVVGLLGTLKAGAAYVPLDPGYPAERLQHMLNDAEPVVVLTQARLKERVPRGRLVIALDTRWSAIAQQPRTNLARGVVGVSSANLAYVIYTSGSTGEPKGAMNEHRGVVNRLQWMQDQYRLGPEDRVLQKTPFSFDVSVWEFFWTLMTGARLVLARPEGHKDPAYLRKLIEEMGVTTLHFVPSMLQSFLDQHHSGECPSLRHVVCSGEELSAALQRKCFECLPQAHLSNLYGPTEAAVDVTAWECRPDDASSRVPIGRPISNIKMYLLDRHGQPVPVGVAGEIHIGGAGVGRGYLNRPELTAERFLPDPFSGDPHARVYKTGDLGRWRPDGTIEYLGRNDHQVKIRGYRIELGEIEAQLVRHAQVKEAVVIAREDVPGEKRLVAYITRCDQSGPSVEELRNRLKVALPEYMVPSAFVILESLPLTPNGKLDRRAMPRPDLGAYVTRQYEPPQGRTEEVLAGIWQDLLQVERVGRYDNFFELGGHSLLIVQMMERLRRVGLSTEVRRAFESATLADFANELTREAVGESEVPPNLIPSECEAITPQMLPLVVLEPDQIKRIVQMVPGGAANVQDIYPLAPLQEGILFHHLLNERGGDTYVLTTLFSLSSRERLEELITALQRVIDRHDVLRTAVLWEQLPRPVQVVYRHATLPIEAITLDRDRDPKEQLKEWIKPERQWLDLRKAPLMRLQIAADPRNAQWYALLQLHHIVDDATSQEIMLLEVMSYLKGRAETLPESVLYRNHVAQALAHARIHDAAAFFRSKLAEIDEPTAPFGLLDGPGDHRGLDVSRLALESTLAQRLRAQARRLGVSAATLFHAAWGLVVSHTSGRDDVVYGTVLLGRLQGTAGAQRALGMFINTLPLRVRLQGLTAKQLVDQTQRELVELLNYEQASLAEAQRCSSIPGTAPLFTALLNYRHSTPNLEADFASAAGVTVLGAQGWTNYPITLSVDDLGHAFTLTVDSDRRVDPHRIANYMHTALQSLVQALEREPQALALELSILPDNERRQLLEKFNETHAAYPQQRVHELFEEQVYRTPEALAVVSDGQSLTYTELNGRANQLARCLIDKGVGPDKLVGIFVERGLEMVIGLLGILKAGGAYVPLDPNYPAERLSYMLNDSAPKVLLVQERLRERLPETTAEMIALDRDWRTIAQQPSDNLDASFLGQHPHHLAYVIYTSGSTGQPKGVAIEHRNAANLICWARYAIDPKVFNQTLFSTSLNFDLSVYECFVPLTTGGCVRVVENALTLVNEPAEVTLINTVPSAMSALLDSGSIPETTRVVNLAGEVLKEELVKRIFAHSKVDRVCNLYGPSETTTYSTWVPMTRKSGFIASIGHPIANTQIYILDQRCQVVPIGAVGEIYIGGAGVARGYLNRPELTMQQFLPDPFSADPRARLYKTGDLGRWRPDGAVEYLGRNDHQLKIRGYRIELGEIEAELARHEQVKEAVVVAREDLPGEKRLVAYVVGNRKVALETTPDGTSEKLRSEVVSGWEALYEQTYGTPNQTGGPSFVGWNSSYTGEPIPEAEMHEWLTGTVERIQALRPKKVLEIGCGVGLVLQHLAPKCMIYVGTDFSGSALKQLRQWIAQRENLKHVELLHRSATELQDLETGYFDTIVVNSVVQYFPDVEYLRVVLQEAVRLLTPGGNIFLGDIRHLGLLPMLHSAVQLSRAAAMVNVGQLRQRIARAVSQENELVIDPQFFHMLPARLPGITGVEVQLKRGRAPNELTRYRYDVVLQVGEQVGASAGVRCEPLEWQTAVGSVAELEATLVDRRRCAVRLHSIPNYRLAREAAAQRLIETSDDRLGASALRRHLNEMQFDAVEPETIWELGQAHGYDVSVSWGAQDSPANFEVRLVDRGRADQASRATLEPAAALKSWSAYANDPLENSLRQQLIPQLREYLHGRLPEYMVPSAWMVLKKLPLTPNGKVDRRALPVPQSRPEELGDYIAPRTELERTLANLWAQVLRVDQVGVQDDFFELGGHSLLAIRALSRINQCFGSALSVGDLYKNPTIGELVQRIRGDTTADEFVELANETMLDPQIVARPGSRRVPARILMLTGCTGFVGRFLLAQLLQDTDATLYCLVRARSAQQALSRIRTTLSRWNLWRDEFERRIVAIPGDLSRPRLGVDEGTYQLLCQDVDSIYHCGTSMNHLETYAMAKPVNVEAVTELLRIATRCKPKLINYISTLGVFSSVGADTARVVSEESPINHEKHPTSHGYLASKWVGERLFMMATERGIPCNIFRLGLVWADTQRGRYDELQQGYRIFKSSLLAGCGIKNYRYEIPPTPVDYVARAVVFLATRHSDGRGIFHISSTDQMVEGVFERCNQIAGTSLELMSMYEWICEMKRLHHAGRSMPALPLIEFAFSMDEQSFHEHQNGIRSASVRFDCARTHAELERAGIVAPVLNDDLLRVYLECMFSTEAEVRRCIDGKANRMRAVLAQ